MAILKELKLADIVPDPNQPRKDFEPEQLKELADSIRSVGVVQPIKVRPNPGKTPPYMIIAGERRWRASGLADKLTIPAVVVDDLSDLSDEVIYAQQLTENLHRADLNPVEKAEFINGRLEYLKNSGITNATETVAAELGMSAGWVSKNIAILKYAPELRALARDGKIRDYSIIKKIATMKPKKQVEVIALVNSGNFNAKEYFSRKRYDNKTVVNEENAQEQSPVSQAKVIAEKGRESPLTVKLNSAEVVKLIDKTDFSSLMDSVDKDWRLANQTIMKSYLIKFKEWFNAE